MQSDPYKLVAYSQESHSGLNVQRVGMCCQLQLGVLYSTRRHQADMVAVLHLQAPRSTNQLETSGHLGGHLSSSKFLVLSHDVPKPYFTGARAVSAAYTTHACGLRTLWLNFITAERSTSSCRTPQVSRSLSTVFTGGSTLSVLTPWKLV